MNIGCIIAGFILLSNPNIGIIDFLPDFIGLFLIIRGVGLAKLYTPFWERTCRIAVILSGVNITKCACIFLLFKNIRALPIVLSFSFAIVEGVLLLLLTHNFFEGLFYIGVRYDIKSVFMGKKVLSNDSDDTPLKKLTDPGVRIKRITYGFFIFRSIISVIPDLSDLQIGSENETSIMYSDLRNLFAITVLVLGLIGTAVFLSKLIPYLSIIRRDPATKSIDDLCDALNDDPTVRSTLRMRRALFILSAIIITSIFVSIDGVILPSFIPCIIILPYVFNYISFDRKALFFIIPSLLGGIFSVFDLHFRREYFIDMNNEPEASLWSPASSQVYDSVKIYTFIERSLLMITLLGIFVLLYIRLKKDFQINLKKNNEDPFANERNHKFLRKLRFLTVICIPVYLLTALEPILIIEIDFISVLLTIVNFIWIVLVLLLFHDLIHYYYQMTLNEE